MSTAGIPRSAVRYRPLGESVQEFVVLSPRASRGPSRKPSQRTGSPHPLSQPKPAGPPLVLVGVGMLVTVLLVLVSQVVVPWAMKTADDLQYGYPRTTQVDHYVGHEQGGTPSHFVAMNLQGQITVVELPGGNLKGAQLLVGPRLLGPGADLAPVRLDFVGERNRPDLEVVVQGVQVRFHNTGQAYVPTGVTG
jgi:hypothetical protein